MIETMEARFQAFRRDVPSRPANAGVIAMGLVLTLLVGAEWALGGQAGAVLAACRGIVLVTLLVLVAEPSVRAGPRVPDVMGIVLATSGLTVDQIAAASRYAPQLNEVGTGPGLHLVSALPDGGCSRRARRPGGGTRREEICRRGGRVPGRHFPDHRRRWTSCAVGSPVVSGPSGRARHGRLRRRRSVARFRSRGAHKGRMT